MTVELPAGQKSSERRAFEHYIRTGRRIAMVDGGNRTELKFNPYHDPRDGRFTFAPGGARAAGYATVNHRSGTVLKRPASQTGPEPGARNASLAARQSLFDDGVYRPPESSATLFQTNFPRPPRASIGGNGGPPLNDPMILEQVFPDLARLPGGSILALADNVFDLTGPASRLTADLTRAEANRLVSQIQAIDPNYHFDSFDFPVTTEGQANLMKGLRLQRAATFYRVRGELRPLQIETLKLMQESADRAYAEGIEKFEAGQLKTKLSRNEAIGNYIDRSVKASLEELYSAFGISTLKGQPVRIMGREYINSGTDRTYRIPDARVGKVAFDVTLTGKTLSTPQIRGFFRADFKPDFVVIVRPKQLGSGSTYIIKPKGI